MFMKLQYISLFMGFVCMALNLSGLEAAEKIISLQDMEAKLTIEPWPADRKMEISEEWSHDGKKSLKLFMGTAVAFDQNNMTESDWRPYNTFRMQVNNPLKEPALIGFELRDQVKGYRNSYHYSVTASPGISTIDIDIGTIWRGEINKQWADSKEGFHKEDVKRFAFFLADGDRNQAIFIDAIQLVHIPKIECEGGFAFDFSDGGGHYQSGWSPVHPWLKKEQNKGFWITGKSKKYGGLPLPTKVLGDGITLDQASFDVELEGGKYIGWYVLERSGFWSGSASAYTKFSLLANDQVVSEHSQDIGHSYFGLQDVEIITQQEIVEDLVFVRAKHDQFSFTAQKGVNSFKIQCKGYRTARIAGLVIAPDNKEGRKYIELIKQQQFDEVGRVHKLMDHSKQLSDPADATENILVGAMAVDHSMKPKDWPAYSSSQDAQPIIAVNGNDSFASTHIGLFVKEGAYAVTARLSQFTDGKKTLPAKNVLVQFGRYMPRRDYDGTSCWIETHHYMPENNSTVAKDKARSLLISLNLDKGAQAGNYQAVLELDFTAKNGGKKVSKKLNITARIIDASLENVSIPAGLFNSNVNVSQSVISTEKYWQMMEKFWDYMGKADKTIIVGAQQYLRLSGSGEQATISGDDALRIVDIVKKESR
ncbi:MAG: hypothetical protein HRU15_14315, partial [Planctomycetes bacterium]|nr:hypothetical protein [Planctomycetota bacterium]